jgi:hypothetical protein
MKNLSNSLDARFKALWADGSAVQKEWKKLETLYSVIQDTSHSLATRASALRTLPEIDADIQTGNAEMGHLFLETLIVSWNRILLRTFLKVHDSLELMFSSINTANAYGCAIAARSIIEHVALLEYFAKRVPWKNGRVIRHEKMVEFTKHLFNLTQGSTFDWDKFLTGGVSVRQLVRSDNWKRPTNERIPHITTLVEALDEEMAPQQGEGSEGYLRFIYSALCDVVHPSWGGDFIYAPRIYREMKIERAFDDHFKKVATLFCLPTVGVVLRLGQLIQFMLDNEPRMLGVPKDL